MNGATQSETLNWGPLRTFRLAHESRKLEPAHLPTKRFLDVLRYPGAKWVPQLPSRALMRLAYAAFLVPCFWVIFVFEGAGA